MLVRDFGFDALGVRLRKVSWFFAGVRFWAIELRGAAWDTAFLPSEDRILDGTTYYAALHGDLVVRATSHDQRPSGALLLANAAPAAASAPAPWTTRSAGTPHVGVGVQLQSSAPTQRPRYEEQPIAIAAAATALWEAAMRFGHDIDEDLAARTATATLEALGDLVGRDLVAPALAHFKVAANGRPPATQQASLDEQRTLRALDHALWRLHEGTSVAEMAETTGASSRSFERRVRDHGGRFGTRALTARAELRRWRTFTACAALSAADTPRLDDLARATGFGSAAALCHAFQRAGIDSPHALARRARRG